MNKKLFSIFMLTLCFIGNMWVSAQNRLTAGESVGAGDFYLYNVGANRFLNNGSQWNTHAALDGSGLQATLAQNGDKYYIDTHVVNDDTGGHHLFLVDGNIYTDGEQKEFKFQHVYPTGYTNAYIISCTDNSNNTFYLGWAGGGSGEAANNVIISSDEPTTENFLWLLISPNNRGIDYTSWIKNPDFERYYNWSTNPNTNVTDWERGGFWLQRSPQPFANAVFAEKWRDQVPVDPGKCYQTISDLPAGTYTLTVTAQAINQSNNNAPCTQGVKLYLSQNNITQSTIIGAAGTYSVAMNVSTGYDLELGVEIENGNDANWVAFDNVRLYKSDLAFSANSATVSNGTTSYNDIILLGATGSVTYSTECYGNIESATVNSNGQISNISYKANADQGGAVVVHATFDGITPIATYVLTVAYTEHLWDFTGTIDENHPHGIPKTPNPNIINDLRANNTDWTVVYKVRHYDNGNPTELNGPVFANATAIDGTNADYNSITSGLLIKAETKAFGANAFLPTNYYSIQPGGKDGNQSYWDGKINPQYYSELLGISPDNVDHTGSLALYHGSTLTIPKLKAGQYVRVKWRRHDEGIGDKVKLTNLGDLKETPITYIYVNNFRIGRAGQGYHVFRVDDDGDVSFQVDDNGWVNIYSIEVSNDFIDDNSWAKIVGEKQGTMDTEFKFYGVYEPNPEDPTKTIEVAKTVFDSGSTYSLVTRGANIQGQQNISASHKFEGLNAKNAAIPSTLTGSAWSNIVESNGAITSTFTPIGHGQMVVVSEGFTFRTLDTNYSAGNLNNADVYYLDLQRTLITVNETGATTQKYPYTWDFTNLLTRTINRLNDSEEIYWDGNEQDGWTPTDQYRKDFTENTEITSSEDPWERKTVVPGVVDDYYGFAEFDGIGFNTYPENGYSTSLRSIKITTDGSGLVIGDKTVTLNIPDVDPGYTVYVRVAENSNSEVKVGDQTSGSTIDGETVYTYTTGSESENVHIDVKNAAVKKIAVTKMTKTCWLKDGDTDTYYNTDSHDRAIDYALTKYFTGNEIKAYTVHQTNSDQKTHLVKGVVLEEITKVAPANAEKFSIVDDEHPTIYGYIVSTEYNNNPNNAVESSANEFKRPLFIPSTQDKEINMATASNDFLKPHVGSGPVSESEDTQYDYYVLTNKYYYTYDNTHTVHTVEVPGFYRLENISTSLDRNRAYLVLPKQSSNEVKFIPLSDFNGELVDAIDEIPAIVTNGIDVNGTFYTLQGLKIEGYPQKGGIYIQNGKKVMVK